MFDVVDWKTGRRPSGADAEARPCSWPPTGWPGTSCQGAPLDSVRAAFVYVGSGETVRPTDLLDAEGLRALVRGVPVTLGPA